MNAIARGLSRFLPALAELPRLLLRLLPLLLPFLRGLIRSIRNCFHRPERRGCCVHLPSTSHKRADPMLYSQFWLMKQGLSVTWDNPDIQIYDLNGVHVSPWGLTPDRDYQVIV